MSGESVLFLDGTKPWLVTKSTFLKASKQHVNFTNKNQLDGADQLCPFHPWICWAFVWLTGLSGSQEAVVRSCLLTARLLLEKKMMIGTPGFHIGIRYVFWKKWELWHTQHWCCSTSIGMGLTPYSRVVTSVRFRTLFCRHLFTAHKICEYLIYGVGIAKIILQKTNETKKNTYL